MTADDQTIRLYDEKAEDYVNLTADGMTRDPRLKAFIAAMPTGGHALDLGCGPGTASGLMADAGLKVTAVDASAEMVALAARHAGITARQETFDDITGDDLYDGIWASFSLLHATRNDLPRYLVALKRALKPGGPFVIAVKSGTGEKRDDLGRFYTYYEEDEMAGLLRDAGFTPDEITRGTDPGLSGKREPWFSVMAHG